MYFKFHNIIIIIISELLDINECEVGRPCHQGCTNTIGSYQCTCDTGYQLDNNQFCNGQ